MLFSLCTKTKVSENHRERGRVQKQTDSLHKLEHWIGQLLGKFSGQLAVEFGHWSQSLDCEIQIFLFTFVALSFFSYCSFWSSRCSTLSLRILSSFSRLWNRRQYRSHKASLNASDCNVNKPDSTFSIMKKCISWHFEDNYKSSVPLGQLWISCVLVKRGSITFLHLLNMDIR